MACRQNGVVFAGLVLSVFRGSVNRKSGTVSVSKAVPAALPFAAVARVHIVKLSPVQGPYYKASSLTGIAVLDPLSSILGELKVSALLDSCTSLQVELEKGAHAALVSMQKDPRKIPRIAIQNHFCGQLILLGRQLPNKFCASCRSSPTSTKMLESPLSTILDI